MQTKPQSLWKQAIQSGLLGGAIALLMSLIGMVAAFSGRYIVSNLFTMGQVLFLAPILLLVYSGLRRVAPQTTLNNFLFGFLAGLSGSVVLAALVIIGNLINLRVMLVNASPALFQILTFNQESTPGLLILLGVGVIIGGIACIIFLLPERVRGAIVQASLWVLLVGLVRDTIITVTSRWGPLANVIKGFFAVSGLIPISAVILFLVIGGVAYWRSGRPKQTQTQLQAFSSQGRTTRWLIIAGIAIVLIFLPQVLGIFFSEILDNVMMYILMGLGLNIVVGFAGLLDLGYVAFFAIGAYVMGVLTSPELGFFNMTFWQAFPFAMVASLIAGLFLGLPVLKMRGDYLAIVTLGFGEIVRLLALSDWLRPWLGGTQGIQLVQQPQIGNLVLNTQQELYYLFLIGVGIVAFIAFRLKDSRIGRAWMALREDEDVAMAMGINHVATKLMAFATGALFSGIAGTIFAAKLTSIYPHSMNFLVSINVLCLIIIGGMGSIPGVFVGSLALVAMPDLLREFAEYRYLAYGALLVVMMLTKPEGLWPEARRRLELHEQEDIPILDEAETAPENPG